MYHAQFYCHIYGSTILTANFSTEKFRLPFMQRSLVQIATALGFTSGSSVLPYISHKCLLPLTHFHSVYAGNETVSCRTWRITATVLNSQSPLGVISDVTTLILITIPLLRLKENPFKHESMRPEGRVTVTPYPGKVTDTWCIRILCCLWHCKFPLPAACKDSELQTTISGYTQEHNLTNILHSKIT